jgi:DNA-binding Xre family transcriptional regulator
MQLSYKKLWKMLIDRDMSKADLRDAAGVSSASIAKLTNGSNITTDVLLKICTALDCKVEDILETITDER